METCQHEVVNPNQGLLSFLYVHNEQSPAYIEPHWHRAVELSYTSKGSIDHFYIAGENFQTQSGQILVVNTQDIHSIRVLNYKEEPELALTITYPYPFLVGQYEDISHCQFDINHPETFSTQQKQAYNHLQDILEMIIRDFQADSPQKNLKLNLGILQVLDILVTSFWLILWLMFIRIIAFKLLSVSRRLILFCRKIIRRPLVWKNWQNIVICLAPIWHAFSKLTWG